MEQNKNFICPEAATDEALLSDVEGPASCPNLPAPAPEPAWAKHVLSDAAGGVEGAGEDEAYWRGYRAAVAAMADALPDDPSASPASAACGSTASPAPSRRYSWRVSPRA